MKLKFIGRGGAFAPMSVGNSNMMLTSDEGKNFIIDWGSTAFYIFRDEWMRNFHDIDGLWISHLHADHCALEGLAFHRYFLPKKDESGNVVKMKLYMKNDLMEEMWENTLRGGLESLQGKIMTLTDYFDCIPIMPNKPFVWEGSLFNPVQTVHVRSGYMIKHSYGLFITVPSGKKIYITGDTQFDLGLMAYYKAADVIFHDCETGSHRSIVHPNYDDLRTLPEDVRNKMWLYHYNLPDERYKADGFLGFVEKNQEFIF